MSVKYIVTCMKGHEATDVYTYSELKDAINGYNYETHLETYDEVYFSEVVTEWKNN